MKSLNKFMFLMLSLVMSFSFTSCGGDDDEPKSAESIVGTWVATETQIEDGVMYDYEETLVFNKDHTGYTTVSMTLNTRASLGETYREDFSWSEGESSDGIRYVTFIHTGGDEIYGNERYVFNLAGKSLNIAGVVFTKK